MKLCVFVQMVSLATKIHEQALYYSLLIALTAALCVGLNFVSIHLAMLGNTKPQLFARIHLAYFDTPSYQAISKPM